MAKLKIKIIDQANLSGQYNTIGVVLRKEDGTDAKDAIVVLQDLPRGHIGKIVVRGLARGRWVVILVSPGWRYSPDTPVVMVRKKKMKKITFTITYPPPA